MELNPYDKIRQLEDALRVRDERQAELDRENRELRKKLRAAEAARDVALRELKEAKGDDSVAVGGHKVAVLKPRRAADAEA